MGKRDRPVRNGSCAGLSFYNYWLLLALAGIELQLNGYWPDIEFHQLSAKDFPIHQIPSSIAYLN